jgi:hypothetical protein
MTAATQATLRSVADNDPSLTVGEKSLFQRLILDQADTAYIADTALSRPAMTVTGQVKTSHDGPGQNQPP